MDSTSQQSVAASAVPRATRVLAVLLVLFSLAALVNPIKRPFLLNFALRPVATVGESKLWNVLTGGFIESRIPNAIINTLLFITMGKWIEASWGSSTFVSFLIIVNVAAAILTDVFMLAFFVLTRRSYFIFDPIATTNGICAALLVAIKQLIPDHEIGIYNATIKANYLPLLYITLISIVTILLPHSAGAVAFTLISFHTSWVYLRFYRRASGQRGDDSDAFAFATMYPEPIRPLVSVLSNIAFAIFRPILVARGSGQPSTTADAKEPDSPVAKASSIDAERRRQRALKALDERLNATSTEEEAYSAV